MPSPHRFPPPWSVDEQSACFVVKDSKEQKRAHIKAKGHKVAHYSCKQISILVRGYFIANIETPIPRAAQRVVTWAEFARKLTASHIEGASATSLENSSGV